MPAADLCLRYVLGAASMLEEDLWLEVSTRVSLCRTVVLEKSATTVFSDTKDQPSMWWCWFCSESSDP